MGARRRKRFSFKIRSKFRETYPVLILILSSLKNERRYNFGTIWLATPCTLYWLMRSYINRKWIFLFEVSIVNIGFRNVQMTQSKSDWRNLKIRDFFHSDFFIQKPNPNQQGTLHWKPKSCDNQRFQIISAALLYSKILTHYIGRIENTMYDDQSGTF